MDETLKIVTSMWNVVQHAPAWLLIIIVLNMVGYYFQWSSYCPNKAIPPILVFLGIALNCLVGSLSDLAENQRNPYVVLSLLGFVQGAAAWLLHGTLVQYLVQKFNIPDQSQIKSDKNTVKEAESVQDLAESSKSVTITKEQQNPPNT